MPDFEKIRLGAPVKAEFEFRDELKRVEVDGHFEVVVPTVSKTDTTHVATLMHDRKRLEYRLIDGRLFRPILEADFQTWKLGDKRGPKPLVVNGAPFRSLNYYKDSPLLGSPWLDWEPKSEEASEAMRARVRRAAPQAWEDAERRLMSAAARGLRFVDGLLFQETRTPGWGVSPGPAGTSIKPAMPDANEGLPAFLLDPRIAAADLTAIGHRLDARVERAGLSIVEPSLLPDTIETDAISAFAIWAYHQVSGGAVGTYDVNRLTDVLGFVGSAERMALEGLPPGESLEQIKRIVQRNRDGAAIHHNDGRTTVKIAGLAGHFMDIRRRFSTTPEPAPDTSDAEDIAQAFRP